MVITQISKNHRQWIRGLQRRKNRDQEGVFVAEGFNALESALRSIHHPVLEVIADRNHIEAVADIIFNETPLYECSDSIMNELSTESTPQGVLTICRRSEFDSRNLGAGTSDVLLYLDRVSDPGNLGTIIRTSAWFGVRQLMLGPSCVDPFNAKSIRASAGALFAVELYMPVSPESMKGLAGRAGYQIIAMVPRGGISPEQVEKSGKNIIMMGQEAEGLSDELIGFADQVVSIRGRGDVESLNLSVASAIILYEMLK